MRSLGSMGLLLSSLFIARPGFAAPTLTVEVAVYWEGRDLHEPNIEALDRLRKAFPAIPLTHFVNPVYFLDEAKNTENLASVQRILRDNDEVALYLAPMEALVKQAGVILKLSPSFWGYVDEGEVCENDCGLDVPLTVYNREETLRLFAVAHQAMLNVGFENLQSFAIRGWLAAPYISQVAASLGYRYDLSPIDPGIVVPKLREFPIGAWVAQRWAGVGEADAQTLQKLAQSNPSIHSIPQRGGIVELNEQREIMARFDRMVKNRLEQPGSDEIFTLGISMENAFHSWPKLRVILKNMVERAHKQNVELRYATAANVKNSRPIAANMRISTRLSQQKEIQK